jgi:tetrapyrrole methylase family protein / MazG family protein
MPKAPGSLEKFESLMQLVASLRGPGGCPWDKEQTHKTLTPYAVEEVYELVEALEQEDDKKLKDELGDVLFQVALHAQLATERNAFTIDDIIKNLNEKMVRRHPHVFSDTQVKNTEEVWKNWEQIKKAEKAPGAKPIDIPEALPALQRSYKIGVKTQKAGFDWKTPLEVFQKVKEEMAEVEVELKDSSSKNLEIEIGDLLFSVAQLARHCGFEPEQTLRAANRKFLNRYEAMHKLSGERSQPFESLSLQEKEDLWAEVKRLQKSKISN